MKLKVYNIAAMAVICLTAISTKNFAQQSTAPTPPVASVPPVAQTPMTLNYSSGNFTPMIFDGQMMGMGGIQDSAYRKKMEKLQEQMRDLQKQMSSLRTDEMKKGNEERTKRYAEQSKMMAERFNKSFSEGFKGFGQNMRMNFDRSDVDLDKKVASGEVKLKNKAYTKSYTVGANDKLMIDNRYGKVTVNTWAKNEFKVDVEIKAYANADDDAQKMLDQVNIKDTKDNSGITFTTVIGDGDHRSSSWSYDNDNGKITVHKTIINYTVYMPAKSPLTISNSYGGIVLPELSGKVTIKNSYGSLTSKALTNSGNLIDVRYGAVDIESLTGSDISVSYGSLNLPLADKLNADIRYSPAKIGKLSTSGNFNVHYGNGLEIVDLDKNLKSLSVNSSYSPIKLSSVSNDNADFDVSVRMAGFMYDKNVNVTSQDPADDGRHFNSTKNYKGHIGKGSSDKLITIKSNYGGVKFDQ